MKLELLLSRSCIWLTTLLPLFIIAGRGAGDSALTITAILFVLLSSIKRDIQPFKEEWFLFFISFWVYMIVRSFFADDISLALKKSIPIIRYGLFALFFHKLGMNKPNSSKNILICLSTVVAFLAIDGYVQFFRGIDILGMPSVYAGGYHRLTGPFTKMALGSIISILSFPLIYYCIHQILKQKKNITLNSTFCFVLYFIIMLSGDRTALIQTTLCMGFSLMFLSQNPLKMFILGTLLLLLTALLLYVVGGKGIIERQFLSTLHSIKNYSSTPYGSIYNAAFAIIKKHWFFGVGPAHYNHCVAMNVCSDHAHHIYLELLTETGVVGLMMFGAVIYTILKSTLRQSNSLSNLQVISSGITIFMIARFLPILPHQGLFQNLYGTPIWFMLGLLLHVNAILNKKIKI
jgi:O-antigen ligase